MINLSIAIVPENITVVLFFILLLSVTYNLFFSFLFARRESLGTRLHTGTVNLVFWVIYYMIVCILYLLQYQAAQMVPSHTCSILGNASLYIKTWACNSHHHWQIHRVKKQLNAILPKAQQQSLFSELFHFINYGNYRSDITYCSVYIPI